MGSIPTPKQNSQGKHRPPPGPPARLGLEEVDQRGELMAREGRKQSGSWVA